MKIQLKFFSFLGILFFSSPAFSASAALSSIPSNLNYLNPYQGGSPSISFTPAVGGGAGVVIDFPIQRPSAPVGSPASPAQQGSATSMANAGKTAIPAAAGSVTQKSSLTAAQVAGMAKGAFKSFASLLPFVSVGMAGYDFYKFLTNAGASIQPDGSVLKPSFVYYETKWGSGPYPTPDAACKAAGYTGAEAGQFFATGHGQGLCIGTAFTWLESAIGSTVQTPTQVDALLLDAANSSAAADAASWAYANSEPLPAGIVFATAAQIALASDWSLEAKAVNSQGISTETLTRNILDISPSPIGSASGAPAQITATKETATLTNGVPSQVTSTAAAPIATNPTVLAAASVPAPLDIKFPTDYNREATQAKIDASLASINKALDIVATPAPADTTDKDILDLTGDSGNIPKFDGSQLNGVIPLPSSDGVCQPINLTFMGRPWVWDICPISNFLHPFIDFLFTMLFGILAFRTIFASDSEI